VARYTPPGRLGEEFSVHYDGTVNVVETPPDGFPVLVGIDGAQPTTLAAA
jgi:hypothetical protein